MIYLDYECAKGHIQEIMCDRNAIPSEVDCNQCSESASRRWKGMGIQSLMKYGGTGGGRDMKQERS